MVSSQSLQFWTPILAVLSWHTLPLSSPIIVQHEWHFWMLLDAFGIYLQECHIEIFWSHFIDGHEWQVMTIFLPTLLPPDLTQFTRYNRHKDFSMMSDQKGSITNDLVKFSQSSHHHKVLPPSGKCRSLNLQWLGWLGSPSGIGNLPPRVNIAMTYNDTIWYLYITIPISRISWI